MYEQSGEFNLASEYQRKADVLARTDPLTPEDFEEWWRLALDEDEPVSFSPEPPLQEEDYEANRAEWRAKQAQLADVRAYELFPAELAKLRAARMAREEDERSQAASLPLSDIGLLAEVLARPAPPPERVECLMPSEASVTLVAQRKAGKTTFVLNLANSFVTGSPFLGKFAVIPIAPDARVAILNFEVSAAQLARWAEDVGIPADRLVLVNLRGAHNPLSSDGAAKALAEQLRSYNIEILIVDPFGRAIGGADQNSAREVQPWLNRLDTFAREMVGAKELVLVVHAGWNAERSRGSSALEDWPDAIWTLTKDSAGLRYFRAEGRDVDVEEDQLTFDPETRHLALAGVGSRSAAGKTQTLMVLQTQILDFLVPNPGVSGHTIEEAIPGNAADVRAALRSLVDAGQVAKAKRSGKGGGWSYAIPTPPEGGAA